MLRFLVLMLILAVMAPPCVTVAQATNERVLLYGLAAPTGGNAREDLALSVLRQPKGGHLERRMGLHVWSSTPRTATHVGAMGEYTTVLRPWTASWFRPYVTVSVVAAASRDRADTHARTAYLVGVAPGFGLEVSLPRGALVLDGLGDPIYASGRANVYRPFSIGVRF
jgi:hypothetical protein